jgi:hypothetical protein
MEGEFLKSTVILADAASANDDGTFSLLRGGISEVRVIPGSPLLFSGSLIVRLEATPEEKGSYDVAIRIETDAGEPVGEQPRVKFVVGEKGSSVLNAAANMHLLLPKLGRYEFSVQVDGKKIDKTYLTAVAAPATIQGKGTK